MKKRTMKKWIPEGMYCHGNGTKKHPNCKWRKYITTVKRDRRNCEFANECNKKCWSDASSSCRDIVYKCEYMNFLTAESVHIASKDVHMEQMAEME